jgi:hypothetical protein
MSVYISAIRVHASDFMTLLHVSAQISWMSDEDKKHIFFAYGHFLLLFDQEEFVTTRRMG